jgi:hypothetical protein
MTPLNNAMAFEDLLVLTFENCSKNYESNIKNGHFKPS